MRMRRLAPAVLLLVLFVPCASAWTWPVRGHLLETFSFDQAHPYAAGQQRGIAIGADAGAPVLAPAAGIVSFAGTVAANGKTVTIQTAAGLAVSLTHLGSIAVQQNDSVAEGVPLGTVGPSGTAEFGVPYVHLGIRDAANPQGYLDPLSFLPVAATPVAAQPVAPRAQQGSLRPFLPVLPAVELRGATASPAAVPVRALPQTHRVPIDQAPGGILPAPAGPPGRVRLAPHAQRAFPLVAALLVLAAAAVGV